MGQLRWLVEISYKSREFSVYTAATLSLPQPDHGVLRKAQRGDERAFSIIVRAYQIPVYNYVLRMVGDRSLAEDLTQEVFLRVFQGLPRFSLRSKFTTWLFQVTKNRVLDELRATERRPRAVVDLDDIPPLDVLDAAEARVLRVEVEQEIRRSRVAVPGLTDRSRIEERPDAAELELRAVRRDAAGYLVVGLDDLQRDVAVPDEDERRVGEVERG